MYGICICIVLYCIVLYCIVLMICLKKSYFIYLFIYLFFLSFYRMYKSKELHNILHRSAANGEQWPLRNNFCIIIWGQNLTCISKNDYSNMKWRWNGLKTAWNKKLEKKKMCLNWLKTSVCTDVSNFLLMDRFLVWS